VSPANRAANIADEFVHADEALRAADALVDLGLYRDAVSRAYYAVYHATLALLLSEELEPSTHSGVVTLLGLHFVKTGKVSASLAATLRRIQGYREAADYTRGFVMPEAECRAEVRAARDYLQTIRSLLPPGAG
jgi:uncharacterized protein (UPF0332 family)